MRLGEINLFVNNFERSLTFYSTVFGIPRNPENESGDYAKLVGPSMTITFFKADKPTPVLRPADQLGSSPEAVIDITTPEFDAVVKRLQISGASLGRIRNEAGTRAMLFTDQDGIGWELIQAK